jgi:hypothetical protein
VQEVVATIDMIHDTGISVTKTQLKEQIKEGRNE